MEKIENSIVFATSYLLFYVVGSSLRVLPDLLILILFLGSPVVVGFMVYKILKDGEAPNLHFDDGYWYEDKDQIESARIK